MDSLNEVPPGAFAGIGFLFGLMVGSFANVCISRIPNRESVVLPASHCPNCQTPILAQDNIPVLSYLMLGGKCRSCEQKISPLYPLVELITALLMAAVFYRFGLTWECLIFAIVVPTLVVITVIDLQHQIIPNVITYPGMIFGLVAGTYLHGWQDTLIGFLLGGGTFFLIAELYFRMRQQEGMGGGDIKYIAAAGALMGWQQVLIIIFVGAFSGALFGAVGMSVQKLNFLSKIPFGPFLALATLISIFFGADLVNWYVGLMQPPAR